MKNLTDVWHQAISCFCRFLFSFLVLLPLFLCGSSVFAQEAVEEEERWLDLPFEVSGNYRADYWGRW
ncbi:MAG: hypothetical protein C4520_04750, partial [Candidatus Abyssobacteria bacterium SURF_5]